MTRAQLVLPHQLFVEHLSAPPDTVLVFVEPDLFLRQYPFHQQKLVLHRASMAAFHERCVGAGFATEYVERDADVVPTLKRRRVSELTAYEIVDDWLERDVRSWCAEAGAALMTAATPNFLTPTELAVEQLSGRKQPRMQHFYQWQRRRLDLLMEGDQPLGGRWSYDTENRKALPQGLPVPAMPTPTRTDHVRDAIAWVEETFPDNPGTARSFAWPTTHGQAEAWLARFLADRFADFGPYEDAMAADETFLFHAAITPMLNTGLLAPEYVVERVVAHAAEHDIELPSLEGFLRQVIGWREYMRASYVVHGRAMRTRNRLRLARRLPDSWYDGTTGLDPVDTVIRRVLETGYAHHIERLMVLGNAMVLLRYDPDDVYEWFMTMFVDAYDWVMVPNVYAMSQFAAGELITTKPYVSGSAYLRRMGDFPTGDWTTAWDALYWQFVVDHRDGFAANPRSQMVVRNYDRMKDERKQELAQVAARWLD